MYRKLFCIVLATGILFLWGLAPGAAMAGERAAPPPARKIPGITAPDKYPRGCVDCHTVRQEINRDVRISTVLRAWREGVEPRFLKLAQAAAPEGVTLKGKHPGAEDAVRDIPAGCLGCHGAASEEAIPLGRMMHLFHLSGGEENPFLEYFGGECTHCHKLDMDTGGFSVRSGPEK